MLTALRKGLGFGLTSGIITTLGLIIGLATSSSSKTIVISGILIIALSDGFSDALGMHVSEEADCKEDKGSIWKATGATLLSKIVFALTFLVPVLLFPLTLAVFIDVGWGLALISAFSVYLAKQRKEKVRSVLFEHLGISILVICCTYFIGWGIKQFFK